MMRLPIALLAGLLCAPHARADEDWGPWDGRWAPMNGAEATPAKPPVQRGAFEALYRSYRRATRRQAKATCPYYPTCSAYLILSVREHGPLLGAMYTTDRLLREYPWMESADHYPLVMPHETPRLHDPVSLRRDRRDRKRVRGADP